MIRFHGRHWASWAWVALGVVVWTRGAWAQAPPPKPQFHASHYDVDAVLIPDNQMLLAQAQAEFIADQASSELRVELNPNLKINSIQLGGQPVPFQRETNQPLDVVITLPNTVSAGQKVTLAFDYSGPLATADNSPSPNVRLAYIGKDGIYLLTTARWFPLVSYNGQRYTAVFHLTVPGTFAVVGTGTSGVPDPVPAPPGVKSTEPGQWLRYTFTASQPGPVGTFVGGSLELTPVSLGGLTISVYTQPSQKSTGAVYAQKLSQIVELFSNDFGPISTRNFTIAQLPPAAPMEGFAAPGLVLVNQRQWSDQPNDMLLGRLAAHEWWNDAVEPATSSDVWLSDSLSSYSGALFVQHSDGTNGFRRAVDDFAVGTMMDEQAAPISQAWRLQPFTTNYHSIVESKGAMVWHMLHTAMGDAPFFSLLDAYFRKYEGQTATLDDFENLAQPAIAALTAAEGTAGAPPGTGLNSLAFFSQWVNSTGVPDFKLDYTVYRTPKGFKVVGKIEQNLTTLNMPVEVKVETEGNPVTKVVQVVGNSTQFDIDTFGEPKPGGILLDPNNNVLKSTSDLRVRAMIAEGEDLAQRGQFFDAVQQYQRALDIQNQNGLALFRMGEAMFYEKNYQAAANSFRDSLDGIVEPSYKWVEVWDHIYLGKIYDLIGQRERAMNEYQRALDTKDNTDGALAQARQYMQKPYAAESSAHPSA